MLVNNYFIYRGKTDSLDTYGNMEYTNPGLKRYSDGSTDWNPFWVDNRSQYLPTVSQNAALHLNNSVVIGTGDTAESISDYRLANDVTGSITSYSQSYNSGADGNALKTTFSISGVNNTGAAITIKEIGICKSITDINAAGIAVMLLRKVLDTPIEVASGESFAFSVEWKESEPETVSATRSTPSETRGETKSGSQEDPNGPEEGKKEDLEPMEEKEDISEPVEEKKISNAEPEEEFEEKTIKG